MAAKYNQSISIEAKLSLHHATKLSHGTGGGFYNPNMTLGRDLAVLAAVEQFHLLSPVLPARPMRLLDAFSGVGALALRWASALASSPSSPSSPSSSPPQAHINTIKQVHITANDRSPTCQEFIRTNVEKNTSDHCLVANVIVTGEDVNVLLSRDAIAPNRRPFDFVHLDPFGCVVPYLDSVFRCLPGGAVLSFTATDVSAVYDRRYKHVAKRHYGVDLHDPRNSNTFRETAVRTVLSAVASAAARQDKGIRVLLSCAVEHFILIQVLVVRGSSHSDKTVNHVRMHENEGPLWMGPLGSTEWLTRLLAHAESVRLGCSHKKVVKLLSTLLTETKNPEMDDAYYSTPLQSIAAQLNLKEIPRLKAVVKELLQHGVSASATHFDRTAIKMVGEREEIVAAVKRVVEANRLMKEKGEWKEKERGGEDDDNGNNKT